MSAPRLTVRIQLQQDHGFSRPLFHKPRRRRWPWLLLVLLMAVGATLYLQPQLLQQWSPLLSAGQGAAAPTPAVAITTASSPSPVTDSAEAIALEPTAEVVTETAAPAVAEPPAAAVSEVLAPSLPLAVEAAEPEVSAAASETQAAEPVAVTAAQPETMAVTIESAAAQPPQPVSSEQLAAALGSQPQADSTQATPTVARALLAANIAEREPVAVIDTSSPLQLQAPTALFYFTELRDLNGKRVTHRWYHNGTLVKERTIEVGAIRWRTWSRHVLDELSGGDWKVQLVDSQGAVLAESRWQVAVPAAPLTP